MHVSKHLCNIIEENWYACPVCMSMILIPIVYSNFFGHIFV